MLFGVGALVCSYCVRLTAPRRSLTRRSSTTCWRRPRATPRRARASRPTSPDTSSASWAWRGTPWKVTSSTHAAVPSAPRRRGYRSAPHTINSFGVIQTNLKSFSFNILSCVDIWFKLIYLQSADASHFYLLFYFVFFSYFILSLEWEFLILILTNIYLYLLLFYFVFIFSTLFCP